MNFEQPTLKAESKEEIFVPEEEAKKEGGVLGKIAKSPLARRAMLAMSAMTFAMAMNVGTADKAEARGRDELGVGNAWESFMNNVRSPLREEIEAGKEESRLHFQDFREKREAQYQAGVAKAEKEIASGQKRRTKADSMNPDFRDGYFRTWDREERRLMREKRRAVEESGREEGRRRYERNKGNY